jgi:hypothetical protein
MRFCTSHWEALRQAIDARGLSSLVAETGEQAARNLASETSAGGTIDNFDPLMGAHNAIVARAMNEIRDLYQQNPMMLFADETAHPEWACPVCALAWCHAEHNQLCTQDGCNFPKEFDWAAELIDGSADFMLSEWRRLGAD